MKLAVRTWLAAAVALALVATVAAAPRPESAVEDLAPVSREVDGGPTTQAIWYVIAIDKIHSGRALALVFLSFLFCAFLHSLHTWGAGLPLVVAGWRMSPLSFPGCGAEALQLRERSC